MRDCVFIVAVQTSLTAQLLGHPRNIARKGDLIYDGSRGIIHSCDSTVGYAFGGYESVDVDLAADTPVVELHNHVLAHRKCERMTQLSRFGDGTFFDAPVPKPDIDAHISWWAHRSDPHISSSVQQTSSSPPDEVRSHSVAANRG